MNNKVSVFYVVDTETTGINSKLNDVIEISMCRVLLQTDNKTIMEQKNWLLKALNPTTIEDEALAINKHNKSDILHQTSFGKENYKEPSDVIVEIENWILDDGFSVMDRIFVGQNPDFDIEFLQELWKKLNSPTTFPFSLENGNRVIDTKQIATLIDLCLGKRRLYYNLGSLAKAFKVKKGKAHSAVGDVETTVNLITKFIQPLREIMITSFNDCYLGEDEDNI